jgi:hypothetical protein
MIHSKYALPRIFPWASERAPEQIDRVQSIGGDYTSNREKQYEFGRTENVGFKKGTPAFTYTMKQFEDGEMKLWYALAGKEDPLSGADRSITIDDIKATRSDIALFTTDDNYTFTGTLYFPKVRVNTFSINVGDPQAIIERNFNLVGEHYISLDANYLAYAEAVAVGMVSGADSVDIILDGQSGRPPVPVSIAASEYMIRVRRERASIVNELVEGTDFDYVDGTKTLTILGCQDNDIIKAYYESATPYDTLWTNHDTSPEFLLAEDCEIHMKVGIGADNRIYRLQTIGIDGNFDRTDWREIGNSEVVQTGVKNSTVTVNLDRYAEGMTLEKILASNSAYPYYDPDDFVDTIQLMVKIWSDKTHTSFRIGYLLTNLSPTTMNVSHGVEDYEKKTNKLESDNILISDDESDIIFS